MTGDMAAAGTRTLLSRSTLLQQLLARAPEYIHFKDPESRLIAASASLVRALGRASAAEVVGRTDFDFFPEATARRYFEEEQQVLRSGTPVINQTDQRVWPTGKVSWILYTRMPLRDRQGAIIGTLGVSRDVTERKEMEQELDRAHRDLVEASRVAGMAEVATGVLHNVGNVLNSLNVSASIIASGLRHNKAESLSRLVALLQEHSADLGSFLVHDPRGRRVPHFLTSLAEHSLQERDRLLQELGALEKNIDHMKEIVAMQQAYATMIGVVEALDPVRLMEDAVRINASAVNRRDVHLVREFESVPRVIGEHSKALQILINLIRNARHACDDGPAAEKRITLRLCRRGGDRVQFSVIDNGVGIPPENLTRIFQHGFTTRARGHGFGLHSAANAAREMNGAITVHSDGPGTGAAFTLELPVAASAADPA